MVRFRRLASRESHLLRLFVFPALALAGLTAGCGFEQQPFPMRQDDVVPLEVGAAASPRSTRGWLVNAHQALLPLLTREDRREERSLVTEDLIDHEGQPIDVYRWFGRDPKTLLSIVFNYSGIRHTAQTVGGRETIDAPGSAWPGFEQVWIPVGDNLQLSGRLGLAREDGVVRSAPCVVVLPGLFGDNGITRMRDVCIALHREGFHALALEMPGHGLTEGRFPETYYTFGVLESQYLLMVSDWLEDHVEGVSSTGLAGFCWGGNLALLATWCDGSRNQHAGIFPEVAAHLPALPERRRYRAGVIAYSPVLDWEKTVELCDTKWGKFTNPIAWFFQETLRRRMIAKDHPEVSGSLRQLIEFEFARSAFGPDFEVSDAYRFLRLLPHHGLPADDKLEAIRVPVLIVSASNDPLLSVQDTADLIAQTENPNVSALVLRGGGHIGFVADHRAHFYSLLMNFFTPGVGPAALDEPTSH